MCCDRRFSNGTVRSHKYQVYDDDGAYPLMLVIQMMMESLPMLKKIAFPL